MGKKRLDITMPFPTQNMIKRASKMVIMPIENGWEVQEIGHNRHKVAKEVKFYTCDCIGFQMRGVCSHITAVRMSMAEKDREDLFG